MNGLLRTLVVELFKQQQLTLVNFSAKNGLLSSRCSYMIMIEKKLEISRRN